MSVLEHRSLRQFLAVVETGSVRAAARELHMSQPPLTAAIQQLEARLGVALFHRNIKGMMLTAAGEVLADEARYILGRLRRAEARVLTIGGQPQPLRVGFVSAALNSTLPTLLYGLKTASRPSPQLYEMTTPEQLDALAEGQIDVGLLHPPIPTLPDFDTVSLGRDPFWVALPNHHRLAQHKSLRFADIASEPFVLFPEAQGPALYSTIRLLVTEMAGELRVVAEAKRVHSQLAIIAGGLGVGLVTRSTALTLSFSGVVMIPLQNMQNRLFLELHLIAEPELIRELSALITNGSNV